MIWDRLIAGLVAVALSSLTGCGDETHGTQPPDGLTLDSSASTARAPDGAFIHWREHLIDAPDVNGGLEIRGADGLAMADLDKDGREDIVSVHEDSGHVRVAFATRQAPHRWHLRTLSATEVDGAEDVVVADFEGDGHLDVVVACERGHLAYFQNPGNQIRETDRWRLTVPQNTRNRGSFIRVAAADFDGDGLPEVAAANKGPVMDGAGTELTPSRETIIATLTADPTPVSLFLVGGHAANPEAWQERELGRLRVPMNSQAIDLDADGDVDVIGGGRGELGGLVWFENLGDGNVGSLPSFAPRTIELDADSRTRLAEAGGLPLLNGWMLKFFDFDGDGRTDILTTFTLTLFGWLRQPEDPHGEWTARIIGDLTPDHVAGLAIADIDGDGFDDVMVGGYSKGRRDTDADAALDHPLGRLAWFAAPAGAGSEWKRHEISRRTRGMFDDFVARDMDEDGDVDFVGTRGNSGAYDGVFWLEQRRSGERPRNFEPARRQESTPRPLP